MKKFKCLILLGIVIFLSIPIVSLSKGNIEEENLLMEILRDLGGNFVEGDVDIGGVIIEDFVGKEDLKHIGDGIIEELEINNLDEQNYWEEWVEEKGFIQLIVQGYDNDKNQLTFTLSSYKDEDIKETSLFINLIKREQFVEINDIIEKIEKIFYNYDKPISITTCIVGTFNDNLKLNERENMILKGVKNYKGKIIEKYKDQEILSFSIYTPYIEDYIYTGSNKMNLNIAIRYDEEEGKSYIWIGTPIITIGY
ncbi:TATA-box binding protein [Keratinibaculum paraultunense]|uniref:TATA-box binding protein n=1 Tax=Keratinibaculum paraultunense TaxID=1278232 RepID=A0A4R3KTG6_9FIRM|nr:YwmB family TATA-box binding protein [Keratinibaculum paraultunense]QQY79174.1 YwmB family TATA-box binding protein [Keratinibaculum paraultunense]TCS88558.1 TATA-box binding protein [Keratinibaculum paraultunense]